MGGWVGGVLLRGGGWRHTSDADLEYGVRRVRAVVAEALHSFLAEADDALRDGAMELQAVLRSLG